jgi:hypothetical protein
MIVQNPHSTHYEKKARCLAVPSLFIVDSGREAIRRNGLFACSSF